MKELFMLDTDICSYIMKENPREIVPVFIAHQNDRICISAITHAEIISGIMGVNSARLEEKYRVFSSLVEIIAWDRLCAERYAEIKNHLKRSGTPIGNMDMMIASSALSIGASLVTNNKKHFSLVPRLKIADWLS